MTATTLTHIAAHQHIDDLLRNAESHRRAAEARSRRRVRLSVPRAFARRVPRAATA